MTNLNRLPLAIILNPQAGNGKASLIWDSIRDEVRKVYDIREPSAFSFKRADSTETYVQKCLDSQIYQFLVIGGDGSLHFLINLLGPYMDRYPITIGLINSGTGCDFARNFGKTDLKNQLKAILESKTRSIDIGQCVLDGTARYFINSLSIGLGGDTLEHIAQHQHKWLPKKIAYLWPGIVCFFKQSTRPLKIKLNGQKMINKNIFALMVFNGQYFGSGMPFAPFAKLDDGALDYLAIDRVSRWKLPWLIFKLYSRELHSLPSVYSQEINEIEVEFEQDQPCPIEMDGELYYFQSLELSVKNKALTIYG